MKDWFPHDYHAARDVKMTALIRKGGGLFYGFYWYMVEVMHIEGSITQSELEDTLAIGMCADDQSIKAFLELIIRVKLATIQDGVISIDRVKRNLDNRREKSEKQRAIASKRWSNTTQRNADAMPAHDSGTVFAPTSLPRHDVNVNVPAAALPNDAITLDKKRLDKKRLDKKVPTTEDVRYRAPSLARNDGSEVSVSGDHLETLMVEPVTTSTKPQQRTGTNREKKPQSIEVAISYFVELGSTREEAEKFWYHYSANGWRVSGRSPMQDWKAAVQSWLRKSNFVGKANGKHKSGERGDEANISDYIQQMAEQARISDSQSGLVERRSSQMALPRADAGSGDMSQSAADNGST